MADSALRELNIMMRKVLLSLLVAVWATGSLGFAATGAASFGAGVFGTSSPSGAPYSTVTQWHIDGRAQAWTLPSLGAVANLISVGNVQVGIQNSGGTYLLRAIDGTEAPAGTANATIPCGGVSCDFAYRVVKDLGNVYGRCTSGSAACMFIEMLTMTGTGFVTASIPMSNPLTGVAGTVTVGDAALGGNTIGFQRWYSGSIAPQSQQPYPGGPVGDLLDYEFNSGALSSDSSTHGNTLTFTGSPSFVAATQYAPTCVVPASFSVATNNPSTTLLTGLGSIPLNGDQNIATWAWAQVNESSPFSGQTPPSTLTFSSTSAENPTVSGWAYVFGKSYTLQLTVTQGAGGGSNTASCSQKYGVAQTDASGNVIISNAQHRALLLPMLPAFANPWQIDTLTNYEGYGKGMLALLIAKLQNTADASVTPYPFVDYWNTAQAGTIDLTNGSPAVVGHSTSFTTLYCQGPTSPTVPKSVGGAAPFLVPWVLMSSSFYPSGTVTDRLLLSVASCTDDTHLTLTTNFVSTPSMAGGSSLNGMSYAYCDDGETNAFGGIGGWGTGNAPANYYDNVQALYAEYYRTGIDDYLYWARVFADWWWQYPGGLNLGAPHYDNQHSVFVPFEQIIPNRSMSMTGVLLRNADSPPFDYSPGINAVVAYIAYNEITGSGCSPTVNCTVSDIRENGYGLKLLADDALTNSNSTLVTTDQNNLTILMNHKWNAANQQANGEFVFNDVLTNVHASSWFTGFTATVSNGSPTVSPQSGNTFDCTQFASSSPTPFGAPLVGNNIPNPIWFTSTGTTAPTSNSQGESAWYYVKCNSGGTSLTLISWNGSSWVNANYTGSLSSGAGWESTGLLGWGNQPYMDGILSYGLYQTSFALATSDPTNSAKAKALVLTTALWMGNYGLNMTTLSGYTAPVRGPYYGRDFVDCEPITNQYPFCLASDSPPFDSARGLNGEALNTATMAYLLYPGNATVKALGDTIMSAFFSCSPGAIDYDGYCGGAGVSAPSGFFYTTYEQSKWVGYYWGVGSMYAWARARLATAGEMLAPSGILGPGIIAEIPNVHTWAMKHAHL